MYKLVVSVISIGLYAAALILISWPMAIVAIGFLALYLIIFQKFIADTESPPEQSEFMEDQLNADSHSVIANLNLIKISNMTRGELSNWANHLKIRMAAQLQAMKRKELINPVKDLSSILMLVAFAWFSSVLVTNSDFFAISQFIIFFLIMRQSVGAISNVLRFPNQWFNVHQNVIKIIDLMSDQGKHITQAGNSPIESISDRIELRHLDFKYPGSKKILRGVSCHFKYGQSNFICGLTGSGKTTILHLLLRLYDCPPSSIYWDHADIRDYELASFYDRIAYAGPNSIFFDESIRFNVTYGLGEVNDDKLIKAADDAQLTGFFQNLEHGYDAKVGEQGVRLSDGEKQRLALMRVFLKDADIVLLDEATSALDGENELSINNALRNQFGSKMIINITHNLSRINPEDHVVMLNNGKVVEEGSCRELLDNRKRFYRLLNSSIKSLPKNKSLYLAKGTKMTT
ncbi:MAG: ABC transporter ATP-binding protein [Cyclobacteriaceae bacterium]